MANLIPIVPLERDSLVLADGRLSTLQPITPASKAVLAAAIRRLSPESRRRRFFSPRQDLSDLELERLTAMDGWNRYALGLYTKAADGGAEIIAGPGALIGELALIVSMRRPSSAVAIEHSSVIRVARSLFQRVLESDPAAARRLRDELATRTSQLASDILMAGAKLSS